MPQAIRCLPCGSGQAYLIVGTGCRWQLTSPSEVCPAALLGVGPSPTYPTSPLEEGCARALGSGEVRTATRVSEYSGRRDEHRVLSPTEQGQGDGTQRCICVSECFTSLCFPSHLLSSGSNKAWPRGNPELEVCCLGRGPWDAGDRPGLWIWAFPGEQ